MTTFYGFDKTYDNAQNLDNMKAVDLTNQLKPYKSGWVAIFDNKVIAHAESFEYISEKVKKLKKSAKDVLLIPASKSYFGFVTIVNG